MAFGSVMRLQVGDITIELAPFERESMGEFIRPGINSTIINKYLETGAKTLEDEYEWYDKCRTDQTNLVWGIWAIHDDSRELIGSTSLHHLEKDFFYSAGTGSLICKREYWGKGIASATHQARTWYAFHFLGIDRLWSEVIQGNEASRRALEKSGYRVINVRRNTKFAAGKMRHLDELECINPNSWKRWWGDDRPTKHAIAAHTRTLQAMKWASDNVTLL